MNASDPRTTRSWALILLVAIAAVGFQPFFLQALRLDREIATKQYDDLPFRRIPGLQQTCEEVRRFVPRGTRLAFVTPYPGWWDGYSFTYMRASYLLPEYRLVPLVDASDRRHPAVLGEVDWVLAIGEHSLEGFERLAGASEVALLGRVR